MIDNLGYQSQISHFPRQKKTDSQKTKDWYKQCVNAGISLINYDIENGLRSSRRNRINNFNLVSNIVDPYEVQQVINPWGIEYGKIAANYRNCPLMNSYMNVLLGEERKRFFNPIVTVINSDAVSSKQEYINNQVDEFLFTQAITPDMGEQEIQQELEKLDKWGKFTYKDRRERMASHIIDYIFRTQELEQEFSRGFEDLLIGGDEIYITDIEANEPILRKGNSVNMATLRSGDSIKIEESDIIVEDSYLPVGRVIDKYYEDLSSKDIDLLEKGEHYQRSGKGFMGNQLTHSTEFTIDDYVQAEGIGNVIVGANRYETFAYGRAFDEEGNVRVSRVVWKGMRKIGILRYIDDQGDLQEIVVDEHYKADKDNGEQVEWLWISEYHEGTMIGNEILVKAQPRPIQYRSMDNLSKCHPGIVGTITNYGDRQALSFVDVAKPYQLLFNAVMARLELAMAKDKGKIGRVDLSMIPDGWNMDQWLYYAETMGWAVTDSFNEGQKGAATGKLAGTMNQNSLAIDLEQGRFIQQQIIILQFLERMMGQLVGVTPQRMGAIENRETVGGVERSVIQSSHITEKWFSIHDNTKVRALKAILETAKVAWKSKSFKRAYVLDDGSQAILDFEWEIFNEAEYGIDISTASEDQEMVNTLKSLAQPLVQNGAPLSMIAEIYKTKDPASLQRKIEDYEQKLQERQQRQLEAEQQQAQAQLQQEQQQEQAKLNLDKYKIDADNETKLMIAKSQYESAQEDADKEIQRRKLEIESEDKDQKIEIDRQKLEETIRHNKATEKLNKSKKQ